MSENVIVVVPIKATEGRGDEIVSIFTPCIEETVKEEGCVRYSLNRDKANPDAFVHIEVWRSQEDLDAHFQQPYLQALLGGMGTPGLLAEAPAMGMFAPEGVGGDKGLLG